MLPDHKPTGDPHDGHARTPWHGILPVVLFAVVAVTYFHGEARGLDRVVPERHRIYGIPITVSKQLYGLDGYVAYQAIAKRFVNDKPIDVILSQDLPRDAAGRFALTPAERADGLAFVPADDKGDITFTRMAFSAFGVHLKALYRLFFALLAGSVAAYVFAFYCDADRLIIGLCVLLAFLSFAGAFQVNILGPFVVTFYDPRIFGASAILPVLHLGFVSVDRRTTSWRGLIAVAYQAFMVVLAVHTRLAAAWLVLALLMWVALTAVRRARMKAETDTVVSRLTRSVSLMPLTFVLIGLLALLGWERLEYDHQYYTTHMAHHLFWHNAGLGFALHPQLGKPYGYITLDQRMMNRVAAHLSAKGEAATLARVFGNTYSYSDNAPDGLQVDVGAFLQSPRADLALYNDLARQIVVETVRKHPWQTAALFGYYKPTYIAQFLLWLTLDRPAVDASGHQILRRKGVVFSPVRPVAVGLLIVALILAGPIGIWRLGSGLLPATLLFFFSLLPQLIIYPGNALMGESLFTLSFGLYTTIAVVLAGVFATARRYGVTWQVTGWRRHKF